MKASVFISSLCTDQINLITVVMFSVDSKNAIHDPLVDSLMILKSTLFELLSQHLVVNRSSYLLEKHNPTCFA